VMLNQHELKHEQFHHSKFHSFACSFRSSHVQIAKILATWSLLKIFFLRRTIFNLHWSVSCTYDFWILNMCEFRQLCAVVGFISQLLVRCRAYNCLMYDLLIKQGG
jgi:hypothetical protein